jgi:hypothetical protein
MYLSIDEAGENQKNFPDVGRRSVGPPSQAAGEGAKSYEVDD